MRTCPICRRPSEAAFRPFCSRRCAEVDLGRWLGEAYRIEQTEEEAALDREDEPG